MTKITTLRKNNALNKNLGYRERAILFSKGARVKVASDYPPRGAFLEVSAGNRSFVFAVRDNPNAKKYTIVA